MSQYLPARSRPATSATSPTMSAPTRSYTLPGPTRQFVFTETLICGVIGVAVKMGVGVNVSVGVSVGSSGVKVAVGPRSIGTTTADVWVAAEIIVCIIAVPRELRSSVGAGNPGAAQASEAINKTVTGKRIKFDFRIVPPFGS